ncbi:DUF3237 family protein [Paractinoplanes atraurantiacus]|uniref:Uncharacterized protein n=1 Tax=Paractinoplanes atraurantiacus TaxID=1036182 RepID=A0A285JM27_9ACTN|nr:DUF3237 family protein [Actinoplanes atraurantiacus]SNY61335.1 Protein of unknown function [Actinoplanes atraurantiacus]
MTLALQPAFTLTVDLAEPREVGRTLAGHRRVIPILGGTVTGPALTGEVLPGGADWNLVRPDGAIHVWARYELRTTEGFVVSVTNEGLGEPGKPIPTRPVFEVPTAGPAWLSVGFFLGELRLGDHPGQVRIAVSQVIPG